MIRYRYNRQSQPPAPFVLATVMDPDFNRSMADVPAQVDTAAYRTVLPSKMVAKLHLHEVRFIEAIGLGGRTSFLPTYVVQIKLRGLTVVAVEVYGCEGEDHILLGRDVLNQFRLVLDGPGLAFEIG